jgi:DNA-binding transcriptional regulator LsrR (DeoR family)
LAIFENIINHKISNITADELLKYASQFNISISKPQAQKIAGYLRGKKVNIFIDSERTALIKEIARITSPETAREVNKLFIKFTK